MKIELKNQIIIAAVIGLALIIGMGWFLVKPRLDELGIVREEIDTAQQDNISALTRLNILKSMQSQSPQIELALLKSKKEVPDSMEYPTLLADIPAFLEENKVEWTWDKLLIAPPPALTAPNAMPTQVPILKQSMTTSVEMQVQDSYVGLINFFEKVRKYPRYLRITSFSINPPKKPEGSESESATESDTAYEGLLEAFFVLDAYQYRETTVSPSTIVGETNGGGS